MRRHLRRHVAVTAGVLAVMGCGAGCGAASTPKATSGVSTPAPAATTPSPQQTESNPPGDIPDNTQFVPYRSHGYEVKVPEGWARTDLATGAGFTDKLNTVRVEVGSAASAPSAASARTAEVPKIQAVAHRFTLRRVETVRRGGGQVVRILYEADSAADPVTGKVVRDAVERYEYFRSGREATLTLSGPVGADNVDPWRTVSDSFRWRR
jgi:hypothetical protein